MAKILLIGGALDGSSHVLPAHLERAGAIFTVAEMPPVSAYAEELDGPTAPVPMRIHHYRVYPILTRDRYTQSETLLYIGHSPDIDAVEALVSMMQFYEEKGR